MLNAQLNILFSNNFLSLKGGLILTLTTNKRTNFEAICFIKRLTHCTT